MPQPPPCVSATTPSTFGIVGQRLGMDVAAEVIGDGARHGGRAVHAGEDADVVAGGDAAVGAHDALEGCRLRRRLRSGARRRAIGVVARELGHRQVVRVHVLAGLDVARGDADDLVVAAHRLAGGDRAHRHLVARRESGPTTVTPSSAMRAPEINWCRAMTTSSAACSRIVGVTPGCSPAMWPGSFALGCPPGGSMFIAFLRFRMT